MITLNAKFVYFVPKKNTFELNAPDEYHKHFESPPLTRPQNTLAQEIILEPKQKHYIFLHFCLL